MVLHLFVRSLSAAEEHTLLAMAFMCTAAELYVSFLSAVHFADNSEAVHETPCCLVSHLFPSPISFAFFFFSHVFLAAGQIASKLAFLSPFTRFLPTPSLQC